MEKRKNASHCESVCDGAAGKYRTEKVCPSCAQTKHKHYEYKNWTRLNRQKMDMCVLDAIKDVYNHFQY